MRRNKLVSKSLHLQHANPGSDKQQLRRHFSPDLSTIMVTHPSQEQGTLLNESQSFDLSTDFRAATETPKQQVSMNVIQEGYLPLL